MSRINTEIVECKQPLLFRKFGSLCIGASSLSLFIIFVVFTLLPDWRPPAAPPGPPMSALVLGIVGLGASVWAWHRGDVGVVQAGPEGIRFGPGLAQQIAWNEVTTCSIRNLAISKYPDMAIIILEDADGKRLFRFAPNHYPLAEAQRFVRYVKLKLADKIIIQTDPNFGRK